jgi:PDZ domain
MSNPFDQFSTDLHGALPNGAPPPVPTNEYNPYGPPQGAGQNVYSNYSHQPPQQQQSYAPSQMNGAYGANQYGPPMQQVHHSDFASSQPYGAPPEKSHYAASGENNPFGGPPHMAPPPPPQESNPFASQALVPSTQPQQSPYALGPSLGFHSPSHQNGYVPSPPSQEQSNPFGSSEAINPFGAPHSSVPPQSMADPWGSHSPHQQYQPPPQPDPSYGAIVPAAPQADPLSVFQSAPAPQPSQPSSMAMYGAPPSSYGNPPPHQQQPPYQTSVAPAPSGDLFGDMGFAPPVPNNPSPFPTNSDGLLDTAIVATEPGTSNRQHESDLPPGGEWYDARIFTPTLGVMFFKPQELTDSLFLNTDRDTVDILAERPVVAFIVEGSSARAAGVELGHVLLKVNGVDVKNPKEASRLIKEGPRPLPLLFYVPPSDIVVAEGEHMVKYDTKDTLAPNSAKDWKPKYVVIGGIIAQPWMMNMYRSKVCNWNPFSSIYD